VLWASSAARYSLNQSRSRVLCLCVRAVNINFREQKQSGQRKINHSSAPAAREHIYRRETICCCFKIRTALGQVSCSLRSAPLKSTWSIFHLCIKIHWRHMPNAPRRITQRAAGEPSERREHAAPFTCRLLAQERTPTFTPELCSPYISNGLTPAGIKYDQ
jgi:hypothetical protein